MVRDAARDCPLGAQPAVTNRQPILSVRNGCLVHGPSRLVYHMVDDCADLDAARSARAHERRGRPVIADELAGKRIAITGSTGFVGTALVERLLRCVPDCELVLLVRDGKRTTAAERVRRELLQERRLRPAAATSSARRDVRRDDAAAHHDDHRRRQHRRPRARDGRPRGAGELRHRDPLGGGGVVRLAARLGGRDQPARPDPHRPPCSELGVTPHLVSVSTCYVAGNRRGTAPEELVSAGPFDLGLDWRTEVAAARRPARRRSRRRAATPGQLKRVPRRGPHASSAPPARPALAAKTEQLRERWVQRPAGRGRPRPRRQRRLARRLRLHQGARRAGARRDPRATSPSRSCARRSSSRRGPSRGPAGSAASGWPSR